MLSVTAVQTRQEVGRSLHPAVVGVGDAGAARAVRDDAARYSCHPGERLLDGVLNRFAILEFLRPGGARKVAPPGLDRDRALDRPVAHERDAGCPARMGRIERTAGRGWALGTGVRVGT